MLYIIRGRYTNGNQTEQHDLFVSLLYVIITQVKAHIQSGDSNEGTICTTTTWWYNSSKNEIIFLCSLSTHNTGYTVVQFTGKKN